MSTETKEQKAARIQTLLSHCNGSTMVFKHAITLLRFTEGVQTLAREAGAHWLLDVIGSHQPAAQKHPHLREFQVWLITVHDDNSCTVSCHMDWDDSDPDAFPPVIEQKIPYTDFPIPHFKFYVEGQPPVLLLPSEH